MNNTQKTGLATLVLASTAAIGYGVWQWRKLKAYQKPITAWSYIHQIAGSPVRVLRVNFDGSVFAETAQKRVLLLPQQINFGNPAPELEIGSKVTFVSDGKLKTGEVFDTGVGPDGAVDILADGQRFLRYPKEVVIL